MTGEEICLSNNYYFLLSLLQEFKMSHMNVRVNYQTKQNSACIYEKMMKSLIFSQDFKLTTIGSALF
jgi:hypothetical protein